MTDDRNAGLDRTREVAIRPVRTSSTAVGRYRARSGPPVWAVLSGVAAVLIGAVLTAAAAWLVTGPIFGYSDTWQLAIDTGTAIAAFAMAFLIQRAQNKDAWGVHLKLNEPVAAVKGASNRLIHVEGLSEAELTGPHQHYAKLVELAKSDRRLTDSHAVEAAVNRHESKKHR